MSSMIGFTAILISGLFTFILAKKTPEIGKVLIVAFTLRVLLSLFNFYIGGLPESKLDAKGFEEYAWQWSKDGFINALIRYPEDVDHGYILSWIISLFYSLTGRSLLMAQTLSVVFGVSSVYLGWKVSIELWSKKIAYKSAWVMAIFPTWLLYSALTLREAYVYFFTIFAILWSVRYIDSRRLFHLLMAIIGFLIASLFHGAMFVGLVSLILFIAYHFSFKSKSFLGLHYVKFIIILLIITFILLKSNVNIPYIGLLSDLDIKTIYMQGVGTSFGNSKYPDFLIINNYIDLLLLTPIRVVYFLFGPMIWDINSIVHIFGFIDGLIYLFMFFLLWKNRRFFSKNKKAKFLLFILTSYIVVFSLGVSNSGTALRHRAKLFPIVVVLSAPFFPYIVIKTNHRVRRKEKILLIEK